MTSSPTTGTEGGLFGADLPPQLRTLADRLYARRRGAQGRAEEAQSVLRLHAQAGDESAAAALADEQPGDPETEVGALRARACSGDQAAAWQLDRLLVDQALIDMTARRRHPNPAG